MKHPDQAAECEENMRMETETIAAIATGMTEAGIGIVRVSGDDAMNAVDSIFKFSGEKKQLSKQLSSVRSHTIHHGYIVDENEEILDEVMVTVMKAPNSYTGENTVEINCHGGPFVLRRVLEEVLKKNVRLAEPGEFTKRAFLNGKMDLSRAEAVMDLIQSRNEWARKASVKQLRGSLAEIIKRERSEIINEIAFIESALDDPENYSLVGYPEKLFGKVENWEKEIKQLIDSADCGRLLKEGIDTVILGKPNVGKSSLLNLMTGEDRAIVTEMAGTTRDVLQESVLLHGISLNLMDTAGIRSTEDAVEKIGVKKARNLAKNADLILYVVDVSVPLDENDREILSLISSENTILLLNKSDLNAMVEEKDIREMIAEANLPQGDHICVIKTCTLNHTGMEELEQKILEMFFLGKIRNDDEVTITNLRHKEALEDVCFSFNNVKKSIEDQLPEDFFSIDLMGAYATLGTVIGEEVGEDLVNEIFSKFCMGK